MWRLRGLGEMKRRTGDYAAGRKLWWRGAEILQEPRGRSFKILEEHATSRCSDEFLQVLQFNQESDFWERSQTRETIPVALLPWVKGMLNVYNVRCRIDCLADL